MSPNNEKEQQHRQKSSEQQENAQEIDDQNAVDEQEEEHSGGCQDVDEHESRGELGKCVEELQAQVQKLQEENEAFRDRHLRLQADFDNYKKRMRAQAQTVAETERREVLKSLLPVLDNFERALSSFDGAEGQDSAVAGGVRMIYQQLLSVLERLGLEEIDAEGVPFDPSLHEAVMREEVNPDQEGRVLQVLQRGYRCGEVVLRPSMVKVGVARSKDNESPQQQMQDEPDAEADSNRSADEQDDS